jgi:Coenzyme F420-reducing hydrogenase, beta subunit
MIDGIEEISCTGCKMCADICPNYAISYRIDKRGFWYPQVDYNQCSKCGLCMKSCPGLTVYKTTNHAPEVYSAWLKDDAVRLSSTSGGLYYALAKRFIDDGSYIAGCRYSDSYREAFHIVTNTDEDLKKLIGSKYFQSDTAGIYRKIKDLLDAGQELLFCGTPCQSAALQAYLKKSYESLFTIDFICKGVTSPRVYSRYISELEKKYHSKVVSVHMKNKKKGWHCLGLSVRFQNRREYFRKGTDDPWVRGYAKDSLFMRPSCHYCRYKSLPRISDITVGDFWGIQRVKKEDLFKGISLVMVNSEKGAALFDNIKSAIFFEQRSLDEAMKENPSMLMNDPESENSELFFACLDSMSVSKAVKKCLKR